MAPVAPKQEAHREARSHRAARRGALVKPGDRVGYSANWLRCTGQVAGVAGHWRGVVTAVQPLGDKSLVTVLWDHGTETKAISSNLAKVFGAGWSAN